MPELEVLSNARPSLFGYPPKLEEKKDKSREKVETAVLSITSKQRKKKIFSLIDSIGRKGTEQMDIVSCLIHVDIKLYVLATDYIQREGHCEFVCVCI